ncbi:MAG: methyl-accepting chemotaxis protein [Gallionellaceae bacterium]
MKINLPVTNVEYVLKETDMIVSKTDLKGAITYINEDFLRISGFTESELIGQSHNCVRHPDMPVEAFADLWKSLKNGSPWTGFVKNRCKNGDFYWVQANATPIYENGQCIGYMSVRSKPSQADVSATSAAYALFRNGQAGGLRIEDGKVVKSNLLSKLNPLKNASVKTRVLLAIGALSVMLVATGAEGLLGMGKANEGLKMVYEDSTIPMSEVSQIQNLILLNRLRITGALYDPTPARVQKNTTEVEENIATISKLWASYTSRPLDDAEKKMADQFAADRGRFVQEGLKPAIAALRANDIKLVDKINTEKIRPLYDTVAPEIQHILQMQIDQAKQEYEDSEARYESARTIMFAMLALGALMAIWTVLTVLLGVLRPLRKVDGLLQSISQGNYKNLIMPDRADELGHLMNAMRSMQTQLGFNVAEANRVANENLRIRIGLDNVSTSVMISDVDRNIIYMNKAVTDLMNKVEDEIRRDLPDFSAAKLMGGSIDAFHKNPAHQKSMLESLKSVHRTQVVVGGRTFALAASPVINERGTRLGAALEWNDRTNEVAVEKEVAAIVEGAVLGDFTQRIDMQGKEGFFKQLGEGINKLMQTSDTGLQEVVRMLGALASGDLTDRITNEYHGTFGQLKDDSNATSDKLKEIIGQIRDATDTINTASKEIASGNTDLSQRTEEQASSLEETAASMEELTATVKQNAENAKQANQLSQTASSVAEKGGAVVQQVVGTMTSINESSRKIVDIISVIDGIAFQTNILALNAAVEAARAGEQGRGFAVVAAEVRNLAQRSAAAANEIKHLIDDSVGKVGEGSKLVSQAGETMAEIVNAVKRVTDIMSEISAASAEQSQGIEQVNQAITQMDEVTQQNAALVEEAAAAAESLEEEAHSLARSVSVFKLDDSNQHRVAASHVVARPPVARAPVRHAAPAKKSAAPAAKPKALPAKAGKPEGEEWEEF